MDSYYYASTTYVLQASSGPSVHVCTPDVFDATDHYAIESAYALPWNTEQYNLMACAGKDDWYKVKVIDNTIFYNFGVLVLPKLSTYLSVSSLNEGSLMR